MSSLDRKPMCHAEYVLAEIRRTAALARFWVIELDTIGVALAGNLIDVHTAVAELRFCPLFAPVADRPSIPETPGDAS